MVEKLNSSYSQRNTTRKNVKTNKRDIEYWKFAEIDRIEEYNFNNLLERFFESGLDGLVRENIQNSLDARLTKDKPVIVEINTGNISSCDIPGFDEIKERIESLKGGSVEAGCTIEHMQEKVKKIDAKYISFEDKNTKGLTHENWNYYAYEKGNHYIEKDKKLEDSRGGSHGVGKIASNAASNLHMMFFSNCNAKGQKEIGGTVQLIEHNCNDKFYRSTGYFTIQSNGKNIAFNNRFGKPFEKDTRGLKIVIPHLRDEYLNEEEMIRAVCDNFFLAILQKNLIVRLNDKTIDSQSIKKIIENKKIYNDTKIINATKIKNDAKILTPIYVNTYTKIEPKSFSVADKNKVEYNFDLYFVYDESIPMGRVAVLRTIGMKIEDLKVTSNARTPFNAVLIPKTQNEDAFLKSLENESHTELSAKAIRDKDKKANATRFINNLEKRMIEIINEEKKKRQPTDGEIDTKDLFYSVENTFKKRIEKNTATISITPNGKSKKSLIVKKDINKSRNVKKNDNKSKKTEKVRKRNKKGDEVNKKVLTYQLKSNQVKRMIYAGKERVLLDIAQDPNYKNQPLFNLHIEIIDGQGKNSDEKINLKKFFSKVSDLKSEKELEFNDNVIYDVLVNEGKIDLVMDLAEKSNTMLKYVYYLEETI